MKYLTLLLLVTLTTFSCERDRGYKPKDVIETGAFGHYRVFVIDKCEYLVNNAQMAHKGNCNNPIHCHNQ